VQNHYFRNEIALLDISATFQLSISLDVSHKGATKVIMAPLRVGDVGRKKALHGWSFSPRRANDHHVPKAQGLGTNFAEIGAIRNGQQVRMLGALRAGAATNRLPRR